MGHLFLTASSHHYCVQLTSPHGWRALRGDRMMGRALRAGTRWVSTQLGAGSLGSRHQEPLLFPEVPQRQSPGLPPSGDPRGMCPPHHPASPVQGGWGWAGPPLLLRLALEPWPEARAGPGGEHTAQQQQGVRGVRAGTAPVCAEGVDTGTEAGSWGYLAVPDPELHASLAGAVLLWCQAVSRHQLCPALQVCEASVLDEGSSADTPG